MAEAAKYGAVNAQDWLTQLRSDLTAEVEDNQQFLADFKRKKSRDTAIRTLAMAFGKYMSEQKQVSFICSQAIWEAIFDFLEERKLSNKKQGNPDIYFAFPQKSLDRYVAKKIGGFMSAGAENAVWLVEQGFRMQAFGGDLWLYQQALRDGLTAVRSGIDKP